MVESATDDYVLQWPGHAAYVTERFSKLLTQQTLVDVTLLCEEQKLRVHKLVLASCSIYFEDMLKDAGPEPTVHLSDLSFSVLKAMIEFMYCGETTVSYIYLPSLLEAARFFKVKELESLVEKMVGLHTPDHNDNEGEYLSKDMSSTGRVNGLINNEDDGIRVSFSNKHVGNSESAFDATESSDSESDRNYLEENCGNYSDSPNDHYLYEESCSIIKDRRDCVKSKSAPYSSLHRNGEVINDNGLRQSHREKSVESETGSSTLDSENCEKDSETNLYERCFDFVNNGCEKDEERSQVYLSPECTDNEVNRVGQCSKVYTHKKRKVNGDNTSKRYAHFEKALPQPLSPNRIDLKEESSDNEAPVTLQTNLDTEITDYHLLSFSSESIQSIVGCSLSDFCPSSSYELLNAQTRLAARGDKHNGNKEEERPPEKLRRSNRLNPQESEETYSRRSKSKLRDDKKNQPSSDIKLLSRTKRKNKELERRVPTVKVIDLPPQSTRRGHSRPLRKASKIAGRCSTKNHLTKNEKEIVRSKAAEKLNNPVNLEKLETTDNHHANESVKTNTTASVNRALWGDMSDIAEDGEINEEFLEYSPSAEIPFAVGLLPLRAALERMQATLDHQPRKTRSSAASTKQDSNTLKRKASPAQQDVPSTAKKLNTNECEVNENASAVCHIQIRTSPQCSRPRKRSLSDGAASLEHTTSVSGRP